MDNETYWAATEAEEALLGAILIESSNGSKDAITATSKVVSINDFTDYHRHGALRSRLYYAMLACKNPPHQINVARQLNIMGILKSGDCYQLAMLVATCPNCFLYEEYAKAIREYSEQRQGKHIVYTKGAE